MFYLGKIPFIGKKLDSKVSSFFRDETKLHKAVMANDKVGVQKLLLEGYKINSKDESGKTPLDYAIVSEHDNKADMVNHLVQNHADLNDIDPEGKTYLHKITDAIIAEILVIGGANCNLQDIYGNTPLHYAAMNGNHRLINILKNNKNVFVKNSNNKIPIQIIEEIITTKAESGEYRESDDSDETFNSLLRLSSDNWNELYSKHYYHRDTCLKISANVHNNLNKNNEDEQNVVGEDMFTKLSDATGGF